MSYMTTHNREGERGIVLVLLLVLLVAIIGLAALVIDIGRLLGITRQAQNAADTAVLAAVNQFRGYPTPITWRRAKKAVLASLKASQLWGCDATCKATLSSEQFFFNNAAGSTTTCDDTNYTRDLAEFGNLRVKLERGVICYEGGVRYFVSLEPTQKYCHANAARVEMRISNIPVTFGKILGASTLNSNVTASSYLNSVTPTCDLPTCASYSIDIAGGDLDPWECACPCPAPNAACCTSCNNTDCPAPLAGPCPAPPCTVGRTQHEFPSAHGYLPLGIECAGGTNQLCTEMCPI